MPGKALPGVRTTQLLTAFPMTSSVIRAMDSFVVAVRIAAGRSAEKRAPEQAESANKALPPATSSLYFALLRQQSVPVDLVTNPPCCATAGKARGRSAGLSVSADLLEQASATGYKCGTLR